MRPLLPLLLISAILAADPPATAPTPTVDLARPSPEQLAFSELQLGAFIHFGLNTFTGEGHGNGKADPAVFAPDDLDVRQWVRVAASFGARYAIFTARHEEGFCLWPTKVGDYNLRSSPWREGKGDLVGEFMAACKEQGLVPCLYFSPGFNAHTKFAGREPAPWGKWTGPGMTKEALVAFHDLEVAQARELVQTYHPAYLWCDHNLGSGELAGIQRDVTRAVMEVAPSTLILGPHVWVVGNESAIAPYPLWNAVDTLDGTLLSRPKAPPAANDMDEDGVLENQAAAGTPLGRFWRPRDAVTDKAFGNGRWFWNGKGNNASNLDGAANVRRYYDSSVGRGANLTINLLSLIHI